MFFEQKIRFDGVRFMGHLVSEKIPYLFWTTDRRFRLGLDDVRPLARRIFAVARRSDINENQYRRIHSDCVFESELYLYIIYICVNYIIYLFI